MPLDWLHQEIDRLTEEASTDEDSDGQMIGVQQPDPEDGTKD